MWQWLVDIFWCTIRRVPGNASILTGCSNRVSSISTHFWVLWQNIVNVQNLQIVAIDLIDLIKIKRFNFTMKNENSRGNQRIKWYQGRQKRYKLIDNIDNWFCNTSRVLLEWLSIALRWILENLAIRNANNWCWEYQRNIECQLLNPNCSRVEDITELLIKELTKKTRCSRSGSVAHTDN